MRTIKLPCFGIIVEVFPEGGGRISSGLRDPEDESDVKYITAGNTLESLILAHACAGVDIESNAYVMGIETAIEVIFNDCVNQF